MNQTIHKRRIRMTDQYQCMECGKSWDVGEDEPPCISGFGKFKVAQARLKEINDYERIAKPIRRR